MILLSERPLVIQWLGMGVALAGLIIYFYPVQLPAGQMFGVVVGIAGMFANAGSAILGRAMNRTRRLSPLFITTVSMGIGSIILLLGGVIIEGFPALSPRSWLIILWLAIVNTAFAFTLWNYTLRTLPAMESSLINSTMSVQIPVLAMLFLGERLTGREVAGLVITIIGVLIVQLARLWVLRRTQPICRHRNHATK